MSEPIADADTHTSLLLLVMVSLPSVTLGFVVTDGIVTAAPPTGQWLVDKPLGVLLAHYLLNPSNVPIAVTIKLLDA